MPSACTAATRVVEWGVPEARAGTSSPSRATRRTRPGVDHVGRRPPRSSSPTSAPSTASTRTSDKVRARPGASQKDGASARPLLRARRPQARRPHDLRPPPQEYGGWVQVKLQDAVHPPVQQTGGRARLAGRARRAREGRDVRACTAEASAGPSPRAARPAGSPWHETHKPARRRNRPACHRGSGGVFSSFACAGDPRNRAACFRQPGPSSRIRFLRAASGDGGAARRRPRARLPTR